MVRPRCDFEDDDGTVRSSEDHDIGTTSGIVDPVTDCVLGQQAGLRDCVIHDNTVARLLSRRGISSFSDLNPYLCDGPAQGSAYGRCSITSLGS
mmetsp:Transcript_11928/g.28297  ORF Transcript_11928/g.28297 Transcript_11928/m.28297 type:complete len:94 (-) Transcript_11928:101-382(-)